MKKSILLLTTFMLLGLSFAKAQNSWDMHLIKIPSKELYNFTGLFGTDGVIWTTPKGAPTQDEVRYLFSGFVNPNAIRGKSPVLIGIKYMITRIEDDYIMGKRGKSNFICTKNTKSFALLLFDEDKIHPTSALIGAQKFQEYIKSIHF